jgi:peptide chain release factor 2
LKWGIHFDIAGLAGKITELEAASAEPGFWEDMGAGQKVLQELKFLQNRVADFNRIKSEYEDVMTLIEIAQEEEDEDAARESAEAARAFADNFEVFGTAALLSGEYDGNNAIVTLHSGAGGTEACDWTEMLLRMYSRWAEKRGCGFEILDYLEGEEAGVKSVTFLVSGQNAFGYMKCEKGIHRLVRISPFNAAGKRQTSFASCDVMPELDDSVKFEIDPEDLRIDTYRSSGAGGQHVNKTESAIRITHIPTGIVVQCQNERSQHKNKDQAMRMLRSKLYKVKQDEQLEKLQGIRGEVKDIGWGSQIRSYVFHPYSMVKDHRTNAETGNVQSVMDGNVDIFMSAYLQSLANRTFQSQQPQN